MYYIYLIQHNFTKEIYVGKTDNLKRRIVQHNNGQQTATYRRNGEWIPIYIEIYRVKKDADRREVALKQHGSNMRWLKDRIKNSFL